MKQHKGCFLDRVINFDYYFLKGWLHSVLCLWRKLMKGNSSCGKHSHSDSIAVASPVKAPPCNEEGISM